MSYEIFQNAKDVKTVRKPEDVEFFQIIMKDLKFERDIDLVVFCASIGLYKYILKGTDIRDKYPSLKKLTSMTTFDRRRLFDLLILNYLKVENERIKEFEIYFYTGFLILKEWFKNNKENMKNTIDLYSNIIDDLFEKQDDQ